MKQYHKIQTVYLRDPETNFKTLLEGQFAKPEFETLKNIDWVWTEKIDGTNIRVLWDGEQIQFKGKTDRADTPKHLLEELSKLFTSKKMKECFADSEVCLYGEGFGKKIQKGGNYNPDKADFILFDCKVGDFWLKRESLEEISEKLQIKIVPIMGIGTLEESIEFVKKGFYSTISHNKTYVAEGLIMKPKEELLNRQGKRIISKIKYKDFKR